jgi:leucyl-tRNA synthetase
MTAPFQFRCSAQENPLFCPFTLASLFAIVIASFTSNLTPIASRKNSSLSLLHLEHSESQSVNTKPFPECDPAKLVQDDIEIVIQVSSKVRAKMVVPLNADESSVVAQAMTLPDIIKHTEGTTIKKQIYVPNKLLNIIVA